jgi:hypothetical protein
MGLPKVKERDLYASRFKGTQGPGISKQRAQKISYKVLWPAENGAIDAP